ncbi:hypothetical protein FRB94_014212 [Tulasnella sp. JGI-2019a]|nr:hypothetical protein FRB93_005441 [Tulasnella sp. JGI-2019a]KAG9014120.1 hypothetical protein FRB94_014212 [Tulasnella sp. JGI-2019a]
MGVTIGEYGMKDKKVKSEKTVDEEKTPFPSVGLWEIKGGADGVQSHPLPGV